MTSIKSNPIDASEESESENTTQNSDSSSEVSDGDDLMEDLENVLDGDFTFDGSFAYASRLPLFSPCLNIDGVGLIGLPLSERDAKLIIECSDQAPYGHGHETLLNINKQVRDTWEIDPHKVSFLNQAWKPFIHWAVQTVCHALGVQASLAPPRCELYKLLLYEPGSHFLPHQDTQKADGMFATMIILLPSAYTGGQVHVSHGRQSNVFDFSKDSMMSFSVLSWYTDVIHEVKPVTSGYRLALSYNLIHVSTTIPKPILPDMDDAVEELRQILKKWKADVYSTVPEDFFVAYLLNHQYSEHELLAGMRSLKGVDAHKISFIRPIAEELGFTVYLGNLTYTQSGTANDSGGGYYKRRKSSYYDDDEDRNDKVTMEEVQRTDASVTCIVDVNGMQPLGKHRLSVKDGSLIPQDPFENVKPDKKNYTGYMGNAAGSLDYWYHRTVLIIFQNENTLSVAFSSPDGGFAYGLNLLKTSNNPCPTQKDKEVAYALIRNLSDEEYSHSYSLSSATSNATTMIEYALKWNDPEMWSSIMERTGAEIFTKLGVDKYFEGCRQFFFRDIEPGITGTLMAFKELKKRLDFIDAVRARAGKDNEEIPIERYKEQTIKALSTFRVAESYHNEPYSKAIELLLHVARTWSLDLVYENALIPLKDNSAPFKFWTQLVESLTKQKTSLCVTAPDDIRQSIDPNSNTWPKLASESEFHKVLKFCLEIIIPQWNNVPTQTHSYAYSYGINTSHNNDQPGLTKIDRIMQILRLCASDDCQKLLLTSILSNWADIPSRFETVYVPLIPQLIEYLNKCNSTITSVPFDGFARVLIYLYLHHILGPKELVVYIEKVGCGCEDCSHLDNFIVNTSQKETTFWMAQTRRSHLEERLRKHTKSLYTQTIRSRIPYGLVVIKRDDFFAGMTWEGRQTTATRFLYSFGDNEVVKALVGPKWDDVLAAVYGNKKLELTGDMLSY